MILTFFCSWTKNVLISHCFHTFLLIAFLVLSILTIFWRWKKFSNLHFVLVKTQKVFSTPVIKNLGLNTKSRAVAGPTANCGPLNWTKWKWKIFRPPSPMGGPIMIGAWTTTADTNFQFLGLVSLCEVKSGRGVESKTNWLGQAVAPRKRGKSQKGLFWVSQLFAHIGWEERTHTWE